MWKLWSKLFGWKYVLVHTKNNNYQYIRRILRTPLGEPYVNFCGNLWYIDNDRVGRFTNMPGYKWRPLTFTIPSGEQKGV